MDALALLCTLHADGPSSLKRLRSRGCGDLSALLSRTPDTVAEDLSIERPAARRLIREARLLADRVGITALEVEEAPPTAAPATPPRALVQEAPATPAPEGGLDSVDRALVERITRPAPARPEVPGAEPEVEGPTEGDAPGDGASTEPRDEVLGELPAWMEGPSVSPADDPFSLPDEDFGAALAPETDAPSEEIASTELPLVEPSGPSEEAAPAPSAETAEVEPVLSEAPVEPEPPALTAPSAGEVAEAIERALPEPSTGGGAVQRVAPLAFGASVFGEGIEDQEEPVEVDLSVDPPEADPAPARSSEESGEPAVSAEPAPDHAAAEAEAPLEVEPVPSATAPPTPEPAPIPAIAEAVAAASSAALPGMDEALVEDLERLGIRSFAELGRAESLALTRGLGVTFAQARRLRFLARRAEADGTAWPQAPAPAALEVEPAAAPPAEPEAPRTPAAPVFGAEVLDDRAQITPEPQVQEPESASPEPSAVEEPLERARLPFAAAIELEPQPEPRTESQPEPEAEPESATQASVQGLSASEAEPVEVAEASPQRGAGAEAQPESEPAVALEPQGVRVDPSEVKARPRFGDQFARAAQQRRTSSEPGRTVLGWNFEIPRPEPEALPLASLLATPPGGAVAEGTVSGAPSEPEGDAAGPFADA